MNHAIIRAVVFEHVDVECSKTTVDDFISHVLQADNFDARCDLFMEACEIFGCESGDNESNVLRLFIVLFGVSETQLIWFDFTGTTNIYP